MFSQIYHLNVSPSEALLSTEEFDHLKYPPYWISLNSLIRCGDWTQITYLVSGKSGWVGMPENTFFLYLFCTQISYISLKKNVCKNL